MTCQFDWYLFYIFYFFHLIVAHDNDTHTCDCLLLRHVFVFFFLVVCHYNNDSIFISNGCLMEV